MKMICDMHDEAMEAVAEIQGWVNDARNTEFGDISAYLPEWLDFISQQAWLIEKAVAEAKQAGIRMERGLSTKRDRIEELDILNSDLESENSELESENSDQASKIADLESEVMQLENTVALLEERLGKYE